MFTTIYLPEFNPAEHGWFPLDSLGGAPAPGSQWSRTVGGQTWPDLLMLTAPPVSGLGVLVTVALDGGSKACPEGWGENELVAYIS
jgi:hypothetical protein